MKALLLALTLSGCIISSDDSGAYCGDHVVDPGEACDDGNNTSGDGCSPTCSLEATAHSTHASWKVQNIDGSNAGCPAGFDQAAVVSWQVDANGTPIGVCVPGGPPSDACHLDYFACVDGSGTTDPIVGGTYLTSVAIVSHDHSQIYAQSLPAVLDLTAGDKTFPVEQGTIYNDGGYFTATWTLIGKTSGSTLSCDTAGASSVAFLSTPAGSSQGVPDAFACADAAYRFTKVLQQGSYTESVVALDGVGGAVGAATSVPNATVQGKNGVTDLGTLVLNVDD